MSRIFDSDTYAANRVDWTEGPVRSESKSEAVLSSMKPNFTAITDLSRELGVIGLHVFCVLEGSGSTVAARNFAPLVGIDEESATGTANGAMLSYLIKNKAIPKKDHYRVEQGRAMDNLSYIYGKVIDDKVWIGGHSLAYKASTCRYLISKQITKANLV
jgi:PhzF family phenazine biosynthesis protein